MGQPQYRFINQRSGPVILPAKQGGLVTISSGQWVTDPWFARFTGKGGLTKVLAGESKPTLLGRRPERIEPAKAPGTELAPQQSQTMLDQVEPPAEEDTQDWNRQTGIYQCKHCGIFRTGSRTVMEAHLLSKHKVPVAKTPDVPDEAPAAPPVPEEEPPAATTDNKEAKPPSEHWCPECKRRFKSADGLVRHRRAIHRVKIPE